MTYLNMSSSHSRLLEYHLTMLCSPGLIKHINPFLLWKHMISLWQHKIIFALKDQPNNLINSSKFMHIIMCAG